jgi:nucleoside-diphosphate-sugar epimerase
MTLYHDVMSSHQNDNLFSLENAFALSPSVGLYLRVFADIGSVWLSLLLAATLVDRVDIATLLAQEGDTFVPLAGIFSMLAFIAYAGTGLYTRARRYTLPKKIGRIICVNLALLLVAVAAFAVIGLSTRISANLLLTAFAGSTLLQCLTRVISETLRSDYSREVGRMDGGQVDDRKVLVIGGAGYVGSALVERLLHRGFQVSVLDAMHFGEEALSKVAGHPNLTLIREDFRHIEVLTRAMSGVGSVVHLGGLVGDPACALDPELTIDINVTATKLVGEIAKAQGVRRFVFASSCSVYGTCDEIVDEGSRFNPQSLYARSKVASEVVLGALNSRDFAVTCLRFATIYGFSGRTRFDLVVNLLCAKAVREGVITVYGSDQWRPFVHVDDVARAIVMTLQAPIEVVGGEAFNVGSDPQNHTLGDMAELIRRQVPDAKIVSDETFVDRRNYRVRFDKIRTRLGFEPDWTLNRGIAQMVALVRSNRVGHYSLSTYSNVLHLKARGTKSFGSFKITGWENELMNIDQIAPAKCDNRPAAAPAAA